MALEKRSFSLSGHRTSIALEPAFWAVLDRMAGAESLSALVARVDAARTGPAERLASALRVAALTYLQTTGTQGDAGPVAGLTRPENRSCPAPSPTVPPPGLPVR